jgi:hypothetical protein
MLRGLTNARVDIKQVEADTFNAIVIALQERLRPQYGGDPAMHSVVPDPRFYPKLPQLLQHCAMTH